MKVFNVIWTKETNLIFIKCKQGSVFLHPSYISTCKCRCCDEEAYWHELNGESVVYDPNMPIAEICFDKKSYINLFVELGIDEQPN